MLVLLHYSTLNLHLHLHITQGCIYLEDSIVNDGEDQNHDIGLMEKTNYDEDATARRRRLAAGRYGKIAHTSPKL